MLITAGEGLTAALVEWLGNNSAIIDSKGNVTMDNIKVAKILSTLSRWENKQIINSEKLGKSDDEDAYTDFWQGNSIFLRHWSTSIFRLQNDPPSFKWGVIPIPTTDPKRKVGAFNGISLGVSKYAKNSLAAVKVINWMTSQDFQKTLVTKAPYPIIPTYSSLFDGKDPF